MILEFQCRLICALRRCLSRSRCASLLEIVSLLDELGFEVLTTKMLAVYSLREKEEEVEGK